MLFQCLWQVSSVHVQPDIFPEGFVQPAADMSSGPSDWPSNVGLSDCFFCTCGPTGEFCAIFLSVLKYENIFLAVDSVYCVHTGHSGLGQGDKPIALGKSDFFSFVCSISFNMMIILLSQWDYWSCHVYKYYIYMSSLMIIIHTASAALSSPLIAIDSFACF